jgi:hypothetical protein
MSTITESSLVIRGAAEFIGWLPKLKGLPDGVMVTNPGLFQPGAYVMRVDHELMTATIEPKGTE